MKFALMALIAFAICAQAQTFIDSRDKKKYKTVKIGEQIWMAQNLDYHGLGLCYEKKTENCKKYGRLYDWKAAIKACPSGWHLPSLEEWQTLVDFAGGDAIAGKKLKAKIGWKEHLSGKGRVMDMTVATDEYGFLALPGGYGNSDVSFDGIGSYGYWWGSTEHDSDNAYIRDIGFHYNDADRRSNLKIYLFSVRCLQNITKN